MPVELPSAYKPLEESVWEMLAVFWTESGIEPDAEPGSVIRSLFEAVGFQIEDASFRFDNGLATAIPLAVFDAFGFDPIGATPAQVTLRFTRASPGVSPLLIPAGFRAGRADGIEYETTANATIAAGASTTTAPAVARTDGAIGNTSANTIVYPRGSIPTLASVTNPQPATGGQDEEPLDEQRRRFARYIAMVHRATRPAIAAAALTVTTDAGERATEVVVRDNVHSSAIPPGVFEVWVDDGDGTASATLVAAIDALVHDYRAAGAIHDTYAVTPYPITIHATLYGDPGTDAVNAADAAARAYIAALHVGEKVSRENLITALTNAHADIAEVTLALPGTDIVIGDTSRATLGSLTVSEG